MPEVEATCGPPAIDPSTASGLYVWRECSGPWKVFLTGARGDGGVVRAAGSVESDSAITALRALTLEDGDVASLEGADRARFDLTTVLPWNDAFSFVTDGDGDVCFRVDRLSASAPIRLGPAQRPISTPSFSAVTGESCAGG